MSLTIDITTCPPDGLFVALHGDEQECCFTASLIPYDSLSELTSSLMSALSYGGPARSRWNTEPTEYDIEVGGRGQQGVIRVWTYPNTSRQRDAKRLVFAYDAQVQSIVKTFWRALRRLESQASVVTQLKHPFPHGDIQRLDELLHSSDTAVQQ